LRPERFTSRALAVVVFATALVVVSSGGARALASGPAEIAPPVISGPAIVGDSLTGSPGTWAGVRPITYRFQWLRCRADAGDDTSTSSCSAISGATTTSYTATSSDVGLRLRFRVQATNGQGSSTSTSAATSVVTTEGGKPANSTAPTISGSAFVGSTLTATTGTWVGDQPITYSYRWLRCDGDGNACRSTGGTAKTYRVVQEDVGRRLRVGVVARNSRGSGDAFSTATDVVPGTGSGGIVGLPGGGRSIDAKDVAKEQRLVVDSVLFDPNPVASRTNPIFVSIRVTETGRGYAVRSATVFIRSTPLLTSSGDNKLTAVDGWVTYELQPESDFPLKNGYNVQFFVKAYRKGDPSLGGIYGSRLVQVPTKSP
jgi:hypothetical protein